MHALGARDDELFVSAVAKVVDKGAELGRGQGRRGFLDGACEFFGVDGLEQVVYGACLEGAQRVAVVCCDDDDGSRPLRIVGRKPLEEVKTEFAGEVHVEKEKVGLVAEQQLPGLVDRGCLEHFAHLGAEQIQFATQRLAAGGFVVE